MSTTEPCWDITVGEQVKHDSGIGYGNVERIDGDTVHVDRGGHKAQWKIAEVKHQVSTTSTKQMGQGTRWRRPRVVS